MHAEFFRARERIRCCNGAGVVFGAVDAVGVAREGVYAVGTFQVVNQRNEKFRATSAAPLAAHGDCAFAA